jgi:photosystem II stability/assembly factor-like uncharacterized protein
VQDVPKFVLKRLHKTTEAESHPDADLLTAFAEQSLLESERARVIEHLSRCDECREVVALALPATEHAEDLVPAATSTRSGWPRWPVLRWSVVIVGLVALTSFGILQYRQGHQKNETLSAVLTTPNEKTAAPELAIQPPPTSFELQEIPPQTKSTTPAESRKKAQSNRQDTSAKDKSTRWLNQPYPASGVGRAVGSGTGAAIAGGSVGGQAPRAAPAPSPSVPPQAVVSASSETVQMDSQAAAAVTTTESQVSNQLGQNQEEQPSKDVSSTNTNLEAVKASPRWSISSNGALQRSADAGNTWVEINIDSEVTASRSRMAGIAGNTKELSNKKVKAQQSPNAGFRALAAFGTEVWAGGSAAMLYHSGDSGDHWTRVLPSSAGVSLTGDVTSIEFSDPRHGAITTSSGERWITSDAGQTWRRQ